MFPIRSKNFYFDESHFNNKNFIKKKIAIGNSLIVRTVNKKIRKNLTLVIFNILCRNTNIFFRCLRMGRRRKKVFRFS